MSNDPKLCWGGCGRLVVFITKTIGRRRRFVAFDAANGEYHNCPRREAPKIFIEAMTDFHKPVRCAGCGEEIYEVPTCGRVTLQFDRVQRPWRTHDCSRPDGILPGIWN